ncbi:MAG: hypothetical protein JW895_02230 [Thermoleophilaceae bacterium]|nr:hypothetical protein [Thermoleophilaceae bacterium]
MAKAKGSNKEYKQMRAAGVRKRVAKELTQLRAHAKDGKRAPKGLREAVDRLEATVAELRGHVGRGDRKAAGRKAARTRKAKTAKRKAAARRGSRKRG